MSRRKRTEASRMEVVFFDTTYIPDQARPTHRLAAVFAPFFMLLILQGVLLGCFFSAFRAWPEMQLLVPAVVCMSAFYTWFFLEKRLEGYRLLAFLFVVILYGAVCFVFQFRIQNGFLFLADCVARRINQVYDGNLTVVSGGSRRDATIFLIAFEFLICALLAAGMVRRQRLLPVLTVAFPVLAMTAISGGTPADVWMYLVMLGFVVLWSASRSRLPGWKTTAFTGLLCLCVSVPAWYLVRPLLALPVADAARTGAKLEMRLMQSLWQILPRLSGGRLNLSLEGIGGGVEDGTLGAVDGYYFTGVEALKVTSDQKPRETVYLKGFVGQTYTGNSFEPGSEVDFSNAAASWKTEGDPSLYIQNLPFLRMMYYENYSPDPDANVGGELSTSANTITVENINANTAYTYVPYQAFLNDYYRMYGGDGYAGGQTVQKDVFSCYWRGAYQDMMEQMRDDEDRTNGVLDRVEASYRAYCTQHDLEVPANGLERLKQECAAAVEDESWDQILQDPRQPAWAVADTIEEIRMYVLRRLLSGYEFELDVDALPEGEDFVERFLYETKEGQSTHFAAAATMMFRLLGVPSRYVVGYVAPQELFTANTDGTYTAILEDDNAHAWTEIYLPFLGWTPVEVTPGMETEVVGDLYMPETETEGFIPPQEQETEAAGDGNGWGFHFRLRIPAWLSGNLSSVMAVVQILLAFLILIYLTRRILRRRRERLGLGLEPDARVRALHRSLYRALVLGGMPEDYSVTGELPGFLAQKNPAAGPQECERLQQMVLQANYSDKEIAQADADWLYRLYTDTWRLLRRRVPLKKRIRYYL